MTIPSCIDMRAKHRSVCYGAADVGRDLDVTSLSQSTLYFTPRTGKSYADVFLQAVPCHPSVPTLTQ